MYCSKMSKLLVLFAVIIIWTIMPGCSVQENKQQHLNYDLHYEPDSLDPAKTAEGAGKQLANVLFEGLVRLKPDGTYEKAMAVDWTMEDSGKRYIFRIRDAKWTNGEKVTAHDFVYAWKRALDPRMKSPYAYLLYDIKNAEGYNRSEDSDYYGVKAAANEIAVLAQDEQTLVVELNKPNPVFYKKLIHPVFFPLPYKAVTESGDDFFTPGNIKGNGPFLLVKHEPGLKYVLGKNKKYWDQDSVSIDSMTWLIEEKDGVNWQLYRNGKIDLTLCVPQVQMEKGLQEGEVLTSRVLANCYIQLNTSSKPLQDEKVRMALSYALDRNKLVTETLQGGQNPAEGLIPWGIREPDGRDFRGDGNNLVPDNNLEEARRLLAEAGYQETQEFPELNMLLENDESQLYLAEFLRSEWKNKLGITVNIIPLSWENKVKMTQKRKYDMVLLGWSSDYIDAGSFLDRYVSRISLNDSGWYNADFDEQMKKVGSSIDETTRFEALHLAEQILMKDLPVLPLYDFTRAYAAKDKVKGLCLPAAGVEVEFKWISIEQIRKN